MENLPSWKKKTTTTKKNVNQYLVFSPNSFRYDTELLNTPTSQPPQYPTYFVAGADLGLDCSGFMSWSDLLPTVFGGDRTRVSESL